MKSWPTKKLGEVLEKIVGGGTLAKANPAYWDGDIPWASVKDIKEDSFVLRKTQDFITAEGLENSAATLIPRGTLIISTRMGLGRVVNTEIDTAINQDLKALFPKKELDSDYLLFFLRSKAQEIIEKGSGATVSGIRLEHIRAIEIPLPSLSEQKKIVAKLEKVLAKIGEAKKLRAEARENADNLLPAELHKIFSQQDSYSLIRANKRIVPKWEEKKLGEVFVLNYGKGLSRLERSEGGKYIVYGANGELGRSDKYLIEGSGLIIGRKGSAGEITRASGKYWPTDVTYFVTEDKNYHIGFTYYLFKFLNFPQYAAGVKPGINRNQIYEIKIPLPPLAEQKKIVARLDSLSEKIEKIKNLQSATQNDFTALEQSVLSKAFVNK